MTPSKRIVRVVIDGTLKTRDPLPEEWPQIVMYMTEFCDERGVSPIAEHEVPGVGYVLFEMAAVEEPVAEL